MGANPKQALGVALFLAGWTLIAASALMDGSVLFIAAGLALVAVAAAVLIKVKPLEHIDS